MAEATPLSHEEVFALLAKPRKTRITVEERTKEVANFAKNAEVGAIHQLAGNNNSEQTVLKILKEKNLADTFNVMYVKDNSATYLARVA